MITGCATSSCPSGSDILDSRKQQIEIRTERQTLFSKGNATDHSLFLLFALATHAFLFVGKILRGRILRTRAKATAVGRTPPSQVLWVGISFGEFLRNRAGSARRWPPERGQWATSSLPGPASPTPGSGERSSAGSYPLPTPRGLRPESRQGGN